MQILAFWMVHHLNQSEKNIFMNCYQHLDILRQKYWCFKLSNNISVSFQDLDEEKQWLPKDKGNVFMLLKSFMKEVSNLVIFFFFFCCFFSISSIGTRTLHVNVQVNVFIFPRKILKNVKQNLLRVFHELFQTITKAKRKEFVSCFFYFIFQKHFCRLQKSLSNFFQVW